MMKKSMLLYTALLVTLLLAAPQFALADSNPLKDPSFELQLPADQGGWVLFDYAKFSSDAARSGEQSIFHWGYSRSVPFPGFLDGSASGSYQEFPAEPGSRWRLTGFGNSPTKLKGAPAFGIVQVAFFDSRGKGLGTVETAGSKTTRAKISNDVNSKSPVGEWIFLDTGIATAPEGTATVQAFTLFVDYSGSGIAQGVYFDDVRLCELGADGDESDCN